jgi:GMP synthase (glutamine-hydrolysing)
MILIVLIYNENIHFLEFVKPIEDILVRNNISFKSMHYKNLTDEIISSANKIIIPGTSLKDDKFFDDIKLFKWIKDFKKPILGICGGMHILGLIFNGKLNMQQEIGFTKISIRDDFLGFYGTILGYELHNYYVESADFDTFAQSKKCPQAIKHKSKPFYGVLFHPEVRNRKLIVNFIQI